MEAQAETAPEVCGLSAEPQRARTLGFRPPTPHVGLALASTDATQLPSEQRWQTLGQTLPAVPRQPYLPIWRQSDRERPDVYVNRTTLINVSNALLKEFFISLELILDARLGALR